jgi:2-methylisocitrate lyase-like PEP mutase family enzyme
MFQHLGFTALASMSAGCAWSTGRPDYALTREDVLLHLRNLSASVDLPVNADFESGFASDPQELARSVELAVETGVSGLSIEDRDLDQWPNALHGVDRACAPRAAPSIGLDRT